MLLSINAGSSSVKVSVFDRASLHEPKASLSLEHLPTGEVGSDQTLSQIREWLESTIGLSVSDIEAIGHRVVHGGPDFTGPVLIDDGVVASLHTLVPLAPNHMPSALSVIDAFRHHYPNIPHVACFDTAFFHDVPAVASTLPLPLTLQKETHLRRYGFHGLSYQALLSSFRDHEGDTAANGRVIMAHLGSGASVAACKNGRPLDMSMGFTPTSGIMMSTRTGDLEPGIVTYLQSQLGMTPDELDDLFTKQSGLLGVSEMTADMQILLAKQNESPSAALAVALFCDKIRKTIGAYTTVLGGVDSIIFSGGIGERSAEIRRRVLEGLDYLGIIVDDDRNQQNSRLISSERSSVGIHVIPAQEDHSIITQTIATITKESL